MRKWFVLLAFLVFPALLQGQTATALTAVRYAIMRSANAPTIQVWRQLDLDNGTFAGSTSTGPGPWLVNPFVGLCTVHGHMIQTGAGACNFTIEGSGDPFNGSGGPVTLFTSSGVLTGADTGDMGQFQTSCPYIRVNRQTNTGTNLCTLTGKP